ncbi:MAG: serine hydrolase domain-containing protein, partial [Candidatus Hodarchaeota archaeon]
MNKRRVIPIILIFTLFLLFIVPFNYADLSSSKYQTIERYLKSELRDSLLPGIAIGIVKDDETVYTNGFGRANSKGSEMTAETPLYVGSVTKGFTALAIMQLNESWELDINDKVTEYLPDFKMADKEESNKIESDKIKIRHLLSHMSGISTETGRKRLYGAKETPEEYVEKLKDEVLQNTPGLRFE